MRCLNLLMSPLVFVIFLACKNDSKQKDHTAVAIDTGKHITQQPDTADAIVASIVCKEFQKDSMEIPYFKVYVSINGKDFFIREVNNCSVIPKSEYARHEIPQEAFDARGGWYAGGGDYFYLILKNGKPVLFEGWQEEGQEDDGYHWTEKKFN